MTTYNDIPEIILFPEPGSDEWWPILLKLLEYRMRAQAPEADRQEQFGALLLEAGLQRGSITHTWALTLVYSPNDVYSLNTAWDNVADYCYAMGRGRNQIGLAPSPSRASKVKLPAASGFFDWLPAIGDVSVRDALGRKLAGHEVTTAAIAHAFLAALSAHSMTLPETEQRTIRAGLRNFLVSNYIFETLTDDPGLARETLLWFDLYDATLGLMATGDIRAARAALTTTLSASSHIINP